jgi:hypothetical protein
MVAIPISAESLERLRAELGSVPLDDESNSEGFVGVLDAATRAVHRAVQAMSADETAAVLALWDVLVQAENAPRLARLMVKDARAMRAQVTRPNDG